MAFGVTIKQIAAGEQALLVSSNSDYVRVTKEEEVALRFGLKIGDFQIFEEIKGLSIGAQFKGNGAERAWFLKCGTTYNLCLVSGKSQGPHGESTTNLTKDRRCRSIQTLVVL